LPPAAAPLRPTRHGRSHQRHLLHAQLLLCPPASSPRRQRAGIGSLRFVARPTQQLWQQRRTRCSRLSAEQSRPARHAATSRACRVGRTLASAASSEQQASTKQRRQLAKRQRASLRQVRVRPAPLRQNKTRESRGGQMLHPRPCFPLIPRPPPPHCTTGGHAGPRAAAALPYPDLVCSHCPPGPAPHGRCPCPSPHPACPSLLSGDPGPCRPHQRAWLRTRRNPL